MEKFEVFDRVVSCEQFDRRIMRYLTELVVVRRMLGKCEVFV